MPGMISGSAKSWGRCIGEGEKAVEKKADKKADSL
jgi:hypothetical protein